VCHSVVAEKQASKHETALAFDSGMRRNERAIERLRNCEYSTARTSDSPKYTVVSACGRMEGKMACFIEEAKDENHFE
jgi:hypothetical protein